MYESVYCTNLSTVTLEIKYFLRNLISLDHYISHFVRIEHSNKLHLSHFNDSCNIKNWGQCCCISIMPILRCVTSAFFRLWKENLFFVCKDNWFYKICERKLQEIQFECFVKEFYCRNVILN